MKINIIIVANPAAESIARHLSPEYEVLCVETGMRVLEITRLSARGKKCVIISPLQNVVINGIGLHRQLAPHIPVIIVGDASQAEEVQRLNIPFIARDTNTVNPHQLKSLVASLADPPFAVFRTLPC